MTNTLISALPPEKKNSKITLQCAADKQIFSLLAEMRDRNTGQEPPQIDVVVRGAVIRREIKIHQLSIVDAEKGPADIAGVQLVMIFAGKRNTIQR